MLAETVRRTFEPGDFLSSEKVQEMQAMFIQQFNHLIEAVKERVQRRPSYDNSRTDHCD